MYHGIAQPLIQRVGANNEMPCTFSGLPDGRVQADNAAEAKGHPRSPCRTRLRNSSSAASALRYQSFQPVFTTSARLPPWPASCGQCTVLAGAGQPHRHVAHLGRRPTQTVDQENTGLATSEFERGACSGHGARARFQG